MSLTWISEPLDQHTAQYLRRDIRAHRRERGQGGHRFKYSELKTLWAGYLTPLSDGEPAVHAVLTHKDDPAWQHWANHPDDGWSLISWHDTEKQAKAAAERFDFDDLSEPDKAPGIYVLASWPHQENPEMYTAPTMRVHCRSKNLAIQIAEAFRGIGCRTEHEEVSAV